MNIGELIEQGTIHAVEHVRDLDGGGRELRVRGRLFGRLSAVSLGSVTVTLPQRSTEPVEGEEARQEGEDDEIPMSGTATVRGVASSTGVDWYTTEMSRRALDSMKAQMDVGTLAYLPTHGRSEWLDQIGEVRSAVIEEGEVPSQAEGSSDRAFLLTSESEVDLSEPLGRKLIRQLRAGRSIGQSIGAWFTELRFIENGEGDIERVIIEELEMDHLAVTRSPANLESTGLEEVRTRGIAAIRSACPRPAAPAPAPRAAPEPTPTPQPTQVRGTLPAATSPEPGLAMPLPAGTRHVLAVVDNGDGTASVRFEIGDAGDLGVDEAAEESRETGADPNGEPPTAPVEDDATNDSDATRTGGDTPNVEEIDMTEEAMAAFVERAVQAGVAAGLAARSAADGSGGAPPAEDTPPEPATERERELLAELAESDAALEIERRVSDRLTDSPHASRRAAAYESPVMREVVTALDDGDLSPLVTLCKEQGKHPKLVRAVENNRAIKRVLGAMEEGAEFERAYEGKPINKGHIKSALKAAFRAYRAGGGFSWLDDNNRGSVWA